MKTQDLATATNYTTRQIRRFARAGEIPGLYKTKGGQDRFKKCPALDKWIEETGNRVEERKENISWKLRAPFVAKDPKMKRIHKVMRGFRAWKDVETHGGEYPIQKWPANRAKACLDEFMPIIKLFAKCTMILNKHASDTELKKVYGRYLRQLIEMKVLKVKSKTPTSSL